MNPLQADPRKRKIATLGVCELSCALALAALIVLSVILHGPHLALILHALAGLEFIAIIVLEVKKQRLKKAIDAEDAEYRRLNPGSTPGVWPPP